LVTPYAVASSVMHMPSEVIESLWRISGLDLNADGTPDLLHPRFGLAGAFNFDIGPESPLAPADVLRTSGPWINFTGFAIDQGPMALLLDNYLSLAFDVSVQEQLIPSLFMSDPAVAAVLAGHFPNWDTILLSNNSVAENHALGTAVGTLSTTDPDGPVDQVAEGWQGRRSQRNGSRRHRDDLHV